MAKKKSVRKSATDFKREAAGVRSFLADVEPVVTEKHSSWLHEYGVIRLYREFEHLILQALVGAVNNDTGTISGRTGITFPKHLTDEVCSYLITGGGYFDFKGRDGLIKLLKDYVPDTHYLVTIVKQVKYRDPLDRLSALRNLAAHNSSTAKARAKAVLQQQRMTDAGSWLKTRGRLVGIIASLEQFADEIHAQAPY